IRSFCRYIDIDEAEFWRVANSYRNPSIWSWGPDGEWRLSMPYGEVTGPWVTGEVTQENGVGG
ncbi:hypothetical protein MYX04_15195, partial [Nitrospiraceae bacterium AH_259_D15_M11_P09]|nr:hypothetical protein [Nitrospiraceae bacterium AH_259_D15_M11_P09]